MDKTHRNSIKKSVTNFFGAVGYLSCTLQWLFACLLYFSLIRAFVVYISPSASKSVPKQTLDPVMASSPLFFIIASTITILMLLFTIYMFVKIPSKVVKNSKKIVHKTAESATPFVLHVQHKKDTKNNHIKLSYNLVIVVKIVLVTTPIILTYVSQFIEKQVIEHYISMYLSIVLACFSSVIFLSQYILSIAFKINKKEIW